MLRRLATGLFKGLLIGGAVGALMHFVLHMAVIGDALTPGWYNYPLYGAVGAAAGALAGRPPWKPGAWIASLLKGVFGIAIGCGLYALAAAFAGGLPVPVLPGGGAAVNVAFQPLLFAPLLAMVYAALVELDDGGDTDDTATVSPGVRVNAQELLASIPDEEEAPAPPAKRPAGTARRKGD